ncbi:hypothetical protein A0H81_07179 [Grifola frondosa]|uniref:Uncharacterized protein n=1 Tax=Grifola frondosa TaxID=5627 RepID=A0A1C7MEB0_GRIFR|nr:hypothetical protein A0H81_07179 [Grifola frondosa]
MSQRSSSGQMRNVDGVYEERETQAIGRIMCYTGFLPIPEHEVVKNMDDVRTGSSFDIRAKEQEKRARRVARMRVYNMRYLSRERHWVPEDDELLQPILALFADAQMHGAGEEEDEESGEDTEEDTDDDEIGPLGVKDVPRDMTPPSSAQLRPDWAYLGAARVVVEANLQDALHGENSEEIRGLVSLDGLRRGSAPRPVYSDKLDSDAADVVARPGEQTESVNGWDWAGVAGVWRRCVCWLDYRDLILHNLSREFDDPRLQEAVRIVPMRLRIASYSPSYQRACAEDQGTVSVLTDGSVRWSLSSTVDVATRTSG